MKRPFLRLAKLWVPWSLARVAVVGYRDDYAALATAGVLTVTESLAPDLAFVSMRLERTLGAVPVGPEHPVAVDSMGCMLSSSDPIGQEKVVIPGVLNPLDWDNTARSLKLRRPQSGHGRH
ncbi:hypothetical protein MVEN_00325200 [Mycena venus]|uniref:Uncharacterized protein n=1 Tax=Mycena venus TaxID=2733690 RepID=A0A8H6YSU8_9AGAR|nr:hypothetical protein MVEN_00325200 [Mycena venus]